MENRFCRLLLAGLLWASSPLLMAEDNELPDLGVDTQIERREISEAMIDSENIELGISFGMLSIEDFGSDYAYVGRLALHVSEDFFAEATYGESEAQLTSREVMNGTRLMTDDQRRYRYYDISLGYHLLPGEAFLTSGRTLNSALYLIGGVGITEFAGDEFFTINYGVGYRLLLNDWMALRLDMRDHMYNIDIIGKEKTSHNMEMMLGATLFF